MSILSSILKRSFGLPELHLNRGAKNVANEALSGYKPTILAALDRAAQQIHLTVTPSATDRIIRETLHAAIERINGVPSHVKIVAGLLIDTISVADAAGGDIEAIRTAVDREIARIKRQITAARF